MDLSFTKMNGAGNDFVVLEGREAPLALSTTQRERLCDRHRGVGADGLLIVEPPQGDGEARFRYYNADGGEAEMCGNGARCFTRFLYLASGEKKRDWLLETRAGLLRAQVLADQRVRVEMPDPVDSRPHLDLPDYQGPGQLSFLNTGVPHVVVALESADELAHLDLSLWGAFLRHHAEFAPAGTNVNFYAPLGDHELRVRTYERGVEGETLACGTGVTACALVHAARTGLTNPLTVHTQGGEILEIDSQQLPEGGWRHVTMTGPADFVFEGQMTLA